jgi:rRNA maturation endonuclease Nob1
LASEFARGLRGLFINGQINQAQLTIVGQLYQRIVSTGGVRISVLNSFGLFQVITAMLAQFGVNVTIPVIVLPVGPAGNLSDATNPLPTSLEAEEEIVPEETAEETPVEEPAEEVVEEVSEEEPVEIAESLPEVESEAETPEVEETEPVVEALQPTETAELESSTEVQQVSSTTVVQQSQTVEANVTIASGRSNRNRVNNAGGVSAMNAIVTTSDIVGGRFQFATSSIFMALIQFAQSLIAQLTGEGQVVFAGLSISMEVRTSVVSVMTGSSVYSASVPTYISSLNGGGALASASVDNYVNNLVNDGVPTNYAQALAATMDGMLTVDENGEVTNVDATKLTTAIAVYNETIN